MWALVLFELFIGSLRLVIRSFLESLSLPVVSLELCFFLQASATDISKTATENLVASIKEGAVAYSIENLKLTEKIAGLNITGF